MEADIMNEEQISQTLLDQMVSSDRGQMIKAAIPYLPPKGQQIFSVYEKAVEFYQYGFCFQQKKFRQRSVCHEHAGPESGGYRQ